jgi:pimeloyl-ACP methyl ester carboxylesterase
VGRDPESFVVEADLPASDLAVYEHPVWGESLKAQIREELARTDGIAWDAGAVYGPWGFEVSQIDCPVSIWQGQDDAVCPPLIGRWLADAIPNARLHALPEAGHFAVYPYWHNVVEELLATSAVADARPS